MLDRYHYDLAGVQVGPQPGVIAFTPDWRGPQPPQHRLAFDSVRGCDVAPVDLSDPAQALRLKAYIWPEHRARFGRLEAAIAPAQADPPDLVQAHAADLTEAELAATRDGGAIGGRY